MSNSCSDECSDNNDDSLPENGNGNTNERMAFQVFDFTQLKQGENESVQEFYNRVVKVIVDLENLVPGVNLPNPAYPRALTSVPEFSKLHPKNRRNAAVRLVKHGAQQTFNFISINIFISGLKPSLREELIKAQSAPKTLYSALEKAQNAERCRQPVRRLKKRGINDIDDLLNSTEMGNSPENDEHSEEERNCDDDDYDEDSPDESRSMTPPQSFDDIGLDDADLKQISTKDLNNLLRKKKIDKERQKEIKSRRRTLKNRTYAANCRIKRDNSDEDLKLEIGHITLQKTEERKEFHKSKEKYHENTGALKKLKYSDEDIDEIKKGNFSSVELTEEERAWEQRKLDNCYICKL